MTIQIISIEGASVLVKLLVSGISYCNTITAIKDGYKWFAEGILRRALEAVTLASPVLHTITCERVLMHLQYTTGYLPTKASKGLVSPRDYEISNRVTA